MTVTQAIQAALALGVARLDAQGLLLHVLGKAPNDRGWLLAHGENSLAEAAADRFKTLAARCGMGEPLAYLTGWQPFYGVDLAVDRRVLVPRPDTETMVDWALEKIDATGAILDLGTGSGAVALAIQQARPCARVFATDASADALVVARANAKRLHLPVAFFEGDWFDALPNGFRADVHGAHGVTAVPQAPESQKPTSQGFDLIVSNPPYIAELDPHLPALAHEPLQALTSGPHGLDALRHITREAPRYLRPCGWLLLEHGFNQAAAVRELLAASGFEHVQSRRDLAGVERCSGGQFG